MASVSHYMISLLVGYDERDADAIAAELYYYKEHCFTPMSLLFFDAYYYNFIIISCYHTPCRSSSYVINAIALIAATLRRNNNFSRLRRHHCHRLRRHFYAADAMLLLHAMIWR